MNGKTDKEILAQKNIAIAKAKELLGEDVEVIDSFIKDSPSIARPLWFLGKSLILLSTADVAFFADGWKDYRGCRVEYQAAQEYGITIIGNSEKETKENTEEKPVRKTRKRTTIQP